MIAEHQDLECLECKKKNTQNKEQVADLGLQPTEDSMWEQKQLKATLQLPQKHKIHRRKQSVPARSVGSVNYLPASLGAKAALWYSQQQFQTSSLTPAAIAKHVWVDQLRNKTVITHSCSCSGHTVREVTLMWTERLERRNAAHSDADSIITNQTFLYVKAQMAPGCLDLMWDLLEI